MFAGAAFTDQADIKATDAVNMLSSLGVITGYTDGSYQPNKVVTRAEMAKMIFVVRNNKIDDSAYQSNYSKLTDISNHWAKGYIKFCESQGIIAGKGNNKFDPDSPVTGVEAAKMLLVVSGYDPDKAGLTGSAWRTNVLKYAGAAGILDDVNSALEQGLPRQYAAQMIYNTLDVNRVKWSEDSKSFDDILNGGVKETVGSAYMGLSYDYGTLTAIEKDSMYIALDDSYDTDNYHNSDRNYKDGASIKFTKVSEDYTSLLGQKVKVMFKDGKTNNVLGVYAIADNTVYTTLMNGVEKDGDKIKFDGKRAAKSLLSGIPALIMPLFIIICVSFGVCTASESAGVAVLYSMLVGFFVYKELTWKGVWEALKKTLISSSSIMLIIGFTTIFTWVLTMQKVPQTVGAFFMSLNMPAWAIALIFDVLILMIGTFIDVSPAILLLTPILLPVMVQYGFSPLQFGAMMITGLAIGLVTPPVGMCLNACNKINRMPIIEIFKGAAPYVICNVIVLISISLWGPLTTALPQLLGYSIF